MKSNVDLVSGAFDGIFVKLDVTIEKGKEFLDVYGERLSVFEQGTVASSEDVGVNLETLNARIGKVDAHLHVLEPEVNARLKPLTEAYVEFIMAWLKVFMLIDNEDTKLTYDARTSCEEVIDKCLARIDQLDRIVQEMGEQASRFNTLITLISQLPHQPGAVVDYPAAQRIAQSEVQLNARLSFHFSTWRRATLMLQEILVAFPVEQTQQQRSPA
jgi:hypothetical protein